ncbi:HdeD family acid-resistance protein [Erythrobacter sp. NE805]|uniref:HdeD family acid-resistance protein n=1 Tax=Erythrobacter sp. NE805 TaxID=3389875 RepID=UPI00396B045F
MAAYPKAQYNVTRASKPIRRTEFVILGALLVVVGAVALAFPLIAAFSLNLLAGITLLTGGIMTLVHAFRVRRWQGFAVQVLLGLLYVGAGLIFIANPFAGLIALIISLGAFFAADGVARVLLAAQIRPLTGWGLFLVSGLLSFILGIAVLLGLASGWSVAFLGLVVGVNMILTGIAFLTCTGTLPARKAPPVPRRSSPRR